MNEHHHHIISVCQRIDFTILCSILEFFDGVVEVPGSS